MTHWPSSRWLTKTEGQTLYPLNLSYKLNICNLNFEENTYVNLCNSIIFGLHLFSSRFTYSRVSITNFGVLIYFSGFLSLLSLFFLPSRLLCLFTFGCFFSDSTLLSFLTSNSGIILGILMFLFEVKFKGSTWLRKMKGKSVSGWPFSVIGIFVL